MVNFSLSLLVVTNLILHPSHWMGNLTNNKVRNDDGVTATGDKRQVLPPVLTREVFNDNSDDGNDEGSGKGVGTK